MKTDQHDSKPRDVTAYRFGDYVLDIARESLFRDGEEVPLRPQTFQVLRVLVERARTLVSREEFFEKIWGHAVVTDGALTQCIAQLRRALGDDKKALIKTVPRRGFVFDGIVESLEPQIAQTPSGKTRKLWWSIALGGLLVGVLFLGSTWIQRSERPESLDMTRIAVLPFEDMSVGQRDAYMGYGVAEDLLSRLGRSPGLKVIARGSSFSLADEGLSVTAIGRRLKADYILEGSLRRDSARIRIVATLVDVETGASAWNSSYDREIVDVLQLQGDIARAVAEELETALGVQSDADGSISSEARSLRLQARYLLYKLPVGTGIQTADELAIRERAISLLERAVELAPDFVAAWVDLGLLERMTMENWGTPRDPRHSKAIDTALRLDSEHPMANMAKARFVLSYERDLERSARFFERAIAADPTNLDILYPMITASLYFGRPDLAVEIGEYVVERDPLCAPCHDDLAIAYLSASHYEDAERLVRSLLAVFPDWPRAHVELAEALMLQGRLEEAMAAYELGGGDPRYQQLGILSVYARMGNRSAAQQALSVLIDRFPDWPAGIAAGHAELGDVDKAFEWLERDLQAPLPKSLDTFLAQFRAIEADPRWADHLDRAGLSPAQLAAINFAPNLPN